MLRQGNTCRCDGRFVARISPRCIYTSGNTSTAAGLTVAVIRDKETGQFGIEPGALILADNVCTFLGINTILD